MFGFFKKNSGGSNVESVARKRSYGSNPHSGMSPSGGSSFFSSEVHRTLSGWETDTSSIDEVLGKELTALQARSQGESRANPYAKRFLISMRSNIIGPKGVSIQAQVKGKSDGDLDSIANDALESHFADWSKPQNCDYLGRHSFLDFQNLAVSSAGINGEFIFRKWYSKGSYGLQLQIMDPQELDISINRPTAKGEIRLGIEYDSDGRIIRYHFVKKADLFGRSTERYSLPASVIIHGFIPEWIGQSRGVPWMHASLSRSKSLDKFDEAAMVSARVGASTQAFISDRDGAPADEPYTGEEDGDGEEEGYTLSELRAGGVDYIGNKDVQQFDPNYPHQMYGDFVKVNLRAVASGWGISYPTISNDFENINLSSIRIGVLEDREIFKGVQGWFINQFVRPVYEDWLRMSMLKGAITIGRKKRPLSRPIEEYMSAAYQGRRWPWPDPLKDGQANDMAINNKTKTRSQVIRDQGGDPEATFREFQREAELMAQYGISTEPKNSNQKVSTDDDNASKDD